MAQRIDKRNIKIAESIDRYGHANVVHEIKTVGIVEKWEEKGKEEKEKPNGIILSPVHEDWWAETEDINNEALDTDLVDESLNKLTRKNLRVHPDKKSTFEVEGYILRRKTEKPIGNKISYYIRAKYTYKNRIVKYKNIHMLSLHYTNDEKMVDFTRVVEIPPPAKKAYEWWVDNDKYLDKNESNEDIGKFVFKRTPLPSNERFGPIHIFYNKKEPKKYPKNWAFVVSLITILLLSTFLVHMAITDLYVDLAVLSIGFTLLGIWMGMSRRK